MNTSVEELVAQVNAGVVDARHPDLAVPIDELNELTSKILKKTGGTPRLHGEWLPLASMIVTICGIVVRLIPLLRGKPKADQEAEVIKALQVQTENPSIADNRRVNLVVQIAVTVINDERQDSRE